MRFRKSRVALLTSALLLAACGGGGGGGGGGGTTGGIVGVGDTPTPTPTPTPAPPPRGAAATPIGVAQFLAIDFSAPDDYRTSLPAHFADVGALDNTPANNRLDNRVATLGRVLFYDPRLSTTNTIACASCHRQDSGFTDARRFSLGVRGTPFTGAHSPRLANIVFWRAGTMFWDRRAASLESQAIEPLLSAEEMGWSEAGGIAALIARMEASPYYPDLFNWAFGTAGISEARIQLALAQFMRAIVSANSRWDAGVATILAANPTTAFTVDLPNLTAEENRGRRLFMAPTGAAGGGGGCSICHVPPTFALTPGSGSNGLDLGERRVFKSPSLRNVGITGPYMHDGRFASLEEVVAFYVGGVQDGPALDTRLRQTGTGTPQRLTLSIADQAAIAAFMRTLTDNVLTSDHRFSNPFRQ